MTEEALLREIKSELEQIRKQTENQSSILQGASTYGIGYAIAFGMNMGHKDGDLVSSAFMALLSWINVGYNLVKHM